MVPRCVRAKFQDISIGSVSSTDWGPGLRLASSLSIYATPSCAQPSSGEEILGFFLNDGSFRERANSTADVLDNDNESKEPRSDH
jgi:hypothetical protein